MSALKEKGKYGPVYRDLWLLQLMADPLLTPRFLKVALVLAMHMNTRTGQTYPSRETAVRLANVCERTVDRAMNALENRGHLKRHTEFNPAKRSRTMRCWPILRVTDRSNIRDRLEILTASLGSDAINNSSTREGREGDFRDSKGPSAIESPSSPIKAECFRLARLG
jgi:hypothetical protein